jgi:uncharacterized protein YrrD
MLTTGEMQGKRVLLPQKDGRKGPRPPKRLGKVHAAVFSPNGRRVVGFMVKRPDIAGMVKRDDIFLALDSFELTAEGALCTAGDASFDDAARERLGLDWDACIIWVGMDVVTTQGKELGYVGDASFTPSTGVVRHYDVGDGGVSAAFVGQVRIPPKMLVGYSDGRMVVKPEAADLLPSGGIAAKAGEGYAKARIEGGKAGRKAAEATGEAVDKGSFELGRMLGKAKRRIAEARADDEPAPARELEDAKVRKVGGPAGDLPEASEGEMKTFVPRTVAKPSSSGDNGARTGRARETKVKGDKGASPSKGSAKAKARSARKPAPSTSEAIARDLGKRLGASRGMFSDFKREFDENSK